jgi:drug/metabolite transporter (DMT)-like permease
MELGDGSAADFNLITYTLAAAFLGLFLLVSVLKSRKRNALRAADTQQTGKPGIKLYVFIAVAMVTLYVADYFNALASGKLAVEILVPLSYIFSMPMTLATDVLLFKERFTVYSVIGLLLVIASAILTNI